MQAHLISLYRANTIVESVWHHSIVLLGVLDQFELLIHEEYDDDDCHQNKHDGQDHAQYDAYHKGSAEMEKEEVNQLA